MWSSLFPKRRKILHSLGNSERSPAAAMWSTPCRLFLWQCCHCGSPQHPCGLNVTGALLTVGDGSPRMRPLCKLMASPVSLQTNQTLEAIHYPSLLPAENETVRFLAGGFPPHATGFHTYITSSSGGKQRTAGHHENPSAHLRMCFSSSRREKGQIQCFFPRKDE